MGFEDLPSTLVDFVHGSVDSVEQVLVLLTMQAQPNRSWTVRELTKELRSVESSIERRLLDLYQKNVLHPPAKGVSTHNFHPSSDKIASAILELAKIYREKPSRLIELIYSKPPQAIQAFADAFKFRKDEE